MQNIPTKMAESEELVDNVQTNRKRKAMSAANRDKFKSRKWSEEELDELIDLLEERVCLWDVFNKEYHNRDRRDRALKEIEEKLGISAGEIKTKIAGLRAQLGRELTKTKAKRSGQATSECYRSQWIYWERLQFLVAVMQAGKSADNIRPQSRSSTESLEVSCESVDSDTSLVEYTVLPKRPEMPNSGISSRRKSLTESDSRKELLSTCIQVLKEPMPHSPAEAQPPTCPFALYVAEKLSHLNKRNRMIAEKRISDILYEIELNAEQSTFQPINWQVSEPPVCSYVDMLPNSQNQYR